jgi:trehalose/maltose hydrolase-like predicted phosphorylase
MSQPEPMEPDRRFEAVVFGWTGTAVAGPDGDASRLRKLIEELCAHGLDLFVVAGAPLPEVDGQLQARPVGPGRLYLCVDEGSEVYRVGTDGTRLVHRRTATPAEEAALDRAAQGTVDTLARRGVPAAVVPRRNGRVIDLAPGVQAPLGAVQQRLRAAGRLSLYGVVELATDAALRAGLPDPRVTNEGQYVGIGLTDRADAARWVLDDLRRRGIAARLVLFAGAAFGRFRGVPGADAPLLVPEAARSAAVSVGPEPAGAPAGVTVLGGGPARFLTILADQLERRRRGDVPDVDDDPAWTLTVDGLDPDLERVHETLLAISDGRLGTRAAPLFAHPAADPGVRAAGVYAGTGADSELALCPDWTGLPGTVSDPAQVRRRLDLRTGVLRQDGPVTAIQFSSLARPATVVLRAEAPPGRLPGSDRYTAAGPLTAAFGDLRRDGRVDRVGGYAADEAGARAARATAEELGFDRLLSEHRAAWAARWDEADIVVLDGDPDLQVAIRLALFHMMAAVADGGEAAVGARGLVGNGYRGHVFWDSDVFVLPFLAATHPAAARAMLEYRIRRLDAARAAARRRGNRGARFPWESAVDGFDVTPSFGRLPSGEIARIRTGEAEEHITADVAWAASCYLDWTGDAEFAAGPARELVIETARYWASRIRLDGEGRGHIYGVIGPDEYHEPVDDNTFTNVMARWNLRRAAALDGTEAAGWRRLADALVDGFDPMSRLYEQFAGFFDLEPLLIADVAPRRPIAAELLLGVPRTRASQVVKQPDVLMLHHLVPDEMAPDSLGANLDFYEPRTAHGSSLSPAVHASLLARAGRFRDALAALRLAARIDLDDLSGGTASGLHMATMGGLWQALVFGFAGIRPRGDALVVDPRIPPQWVGLQVRLRFRGSPFTLRIDHQTVELDAAGPLTLTRRDGHWEVRAT